MSDKRYPTRMHEVLGVATEDRFTFSEYGDRKFWLSGSGLLYCVNDDGTSIPATQGALVFFINNPERIVRHTRLTEEQVAQLKALHTLGYRWLTKDKWKGVSAFICKPFKGEHGGEWMRYDPMLVDDGYIVFNGYTQITDLVSWSDPEPLDIVQVLRQNGEEVEG